jgi:hypothetical protein
MVGAVVILSNAGFLGTGATFEADLNLVVQLVMGVALIVRSCLAKQKLQVSRYLPDDGAALELVDDWAGDVAVIQATSEACAG